MPFFNSSSPMQGGLPPEALRLISLARAQGVSEDEISQMLESSGFEPDDYQDDVAPLVDGGADLGFNEDTSLPAWDPSPIGMGDTGGDINASIDSAADAYGVPRDVAQNWFDVENAPRDPRATNPNSSAVGLGQLTDAAREDYNRAHGTNFTREDFMDPDLNLDASFWYLTTRKGDTLDDKLRAYNQGDAGAAQGRGQDYVAQVRGRDATAAAAPPAYDDLATERVTGPRGDLLDAEPGAGQDQPTEPRGVGQRVLDMLSSGPMAEALMATGFGMLGAQGTYGNLGAAVGQGGLKGVEAFGLATRRAQKEREAAERTRMAEQRLLAQEDARKASRGNVLLQTAMMVVDRGGPDALAAFVKANPELRDLLGGDGFDPSLFRSKNGWKSGIYGDKLVLYNDSGEVQVKQLPISNPDTHEVTIGGPEGDQVVAVDKQGNVRRTIGPAPSTRGGQSKFLEARDPDSPDSGAMVYVQPDPRTGELRPVLGPDGQKVYSRGSGNRPFVRDDNGNVVSASRSGADIPAARKSQLYEAQDRYRLVAPQVRLLIGERDADGNYNGGILTDDVIGAAKAVAQKGKGWKAQVPALRRTIAKLDLKRPTMPAGGSSTPDTEKFTRAAWFKDVSQADYLLNALAFHLALASNPDGRISDQDIKIARARLGGDDWLSSGADVRTRVGNFADEAARGAVISYIAFGQEERLPENLRGAYLQLNPGDLEPEARTKREGLKQKWGVPKDAPREAPAPDAGGTVVAVGPGGVRKTVPAARAAAGLPSGWSVEGR